MAERDLGLEDPVFLMSEAFNAGYEHGWQDRNYVTDPLADHVRLLFEQWMEADQ
jgi:hypothetical protein